MSIIDQAESVEVLAVNHPHYAEMIFDTGLPNQIETYLLLEYLDVTRDNYFNDLTRKKVDTIYKWASLQGEDPLEIIRSFDIKLGVTGMQTTLDKLYNYARMDIELNHKFQEVSNLLKEKDKYENSGSIPRQQSEDSVPQGEVPQAV